MRVSRRNVMKLLAGAGVSALTRPAFAQAAGLNPNHLFAFLYFAGGWDVTMSLDPRDPALDSQKDNTGIEMGWGELPASFSRVPLTPAGSNITFGPAIGNLAQHFDKLCVARGLSMGTLTHEVGFRYFLTGKPPSGLTPRGSSMGSEIVDQLAAAEPSKVRELANFTLDIDSYYTGDRPEARAFRGSSRSTLAVGASFQRSLLPPGPEPAPGAATLGDMVLAATARTANQLLPHRARGFCDPTHIDSNGVMTRVRKAQEQNERMFASPLLSEFNLGEVPTALKSLSYGGGLPPAAGSPGLAAFFTRQALVSGLANVVTATIQDDLDTHTSLHPVQHPTRLKAGFDAVAALIADLEQTPHPHLPGKMLDHTTLVLFSEFSRTARLNAARGRDHSLTNCCVLAGKGIRGNRVVGASSDNAMQPQAINSTTGQVSSANDAVVMQPEHILSTVLEVAGYRRDQLLVPGLPCIKSS